MCISVPMQVVEIFPSTDGKRAGTVNYDGALRPVSFDALPDVTVGDYVLVQFGLATSRMDAADAERTLALLRELDNLYSNEEEEEEEP